MSKQFIGATHAVRHVNGLVLAETGYAPDQSIESHPHAEALCCLVLEGAMTERWGRRRVDCETGRMTYLPPNEPHGQEHHADGSRCFLVEFGTSWTDRMSELGVRWPDGPLNLDGTRANCMASQMHRELRSDDTAAALTIEGLALTMLGEIARAGSPREREPLPGWLIRAVELLHSRKSESVSMSAIATEVGVHPTHLARTFRDRYDCTMGEFLRRIRVEAACTQLASTRRPISAIAFECGFSDQPHFTRVFRRLTGQTPAAWRTANASRSGARVVASSAATTAVPASSASSVSSVRPCRPRHANSVQHIARAVQYIRAAPTYLPVTAHWKGRKPMSARFAIALTAASVMLHTGCIAQSSSAQRADRLAPDPSTMAIEPYQPRFGRDRPVITVLAHSSGAEVTDFVVPYGVLASSGEAEVIAVSDGPDAIPMFPALTIEPDATLEEFDLRFPEGADYVIVPAMHRADDPQLLAWIRAQSARGATLVGICDGVLILANAGVLDDRRATGHWFSMGGLQRDHPDTKWVRDQRYVADGSVVTTTGVSASLPVSIALVEAIAGRDRAEEVAASYGLDDWSAAHESDAYGIRGHIGTALGNRLAFWRHEDVGIAVDAGTDAVALALQADMWSRTYRSSAQILAASADPIVTRTGLRIHPDRVVTPHNRPDRMIEPLAAEAAGSAIEITLDEIAAAYGSSTAAFVAVQIEYSGEDLKRAR